MKSLKYAAMAAVMGWAALSGEDATAQGYYGYPTAVPVSRQYMPTSNYYSGYAPANCYPQPACVPICPPNCYPAGQYGRPSYTVPGGNYGSPVYSQPSGNFGTPVYVQPSENFSTPVYYRGESYPNGVYPNGGYPNGGYYGAPMNRPFMPGVGHFSVEDDQTTEQPATAATKNPKNGSNSPFYDEAGSRLAPSGNVRTQPAAPARTIDNPFYN